MIHLFLNGLSASAGGGLTYVRNVLPHLAGKPSVRTTVCVPESLGREFSSWTNVQMLEDGSPSDTARRFLWEQRNIPKLICQHKADVLLSVGNFSVFRSPVPQILLSRNALYVSDEFYRDLRQRRHYSLWLDTKIKGIIARQSIRSASVTLAPSDTFARELTRWAGVKVGSLHHGFDAARFSAGSEPLPSDIAEKLAVQPGTARLLFVSHYNYYRNFHTLFRALPFLEKKLGRPFKLFLTCRLNSPTEHGSYRPSRELEFIRANGLTDALVELGTTPYDLLHHVYRACDLYVSPAYAETFAHPLVEAMSCSLPIVAADIPVHRETCGEAAVYFPAFDAESLADTAANVLLDADALARMSAKGLEQVKSFSWQKHVDQLLDIAVALKG